MRKSFVLIIGPGGDDLDTIAEYLVGAGCDVQTASSIGQGIAIANGHSPDVVVIHQAVLEDEPDSRAVLLYGRFGAQSAPVVVMAPPARDVSREMPATGALKMAEEPRLMDLAQFAAGLSTLAGAVSEEQLQATHVSTQGLHLDRRAFRASIDGRELRLTLTEFNILWMLARHAGDVLSRHDLCSECSTEDRSGRCRSVDVHVRSLRCKLAERAQLIETVRNVGYRIPDQTPMAAVANR